MNRVADDEQGVNVRVFAKPARESTNFAEGPEALERDMFVLHGLIGEEHKVVALGRRDRLSDLQEVERDRQAHFGEAANFETADADKSGGCKALTEEVERVLLAVHFSSKHENEAGGSRWARGREPGVEARPKRRVC